MMETYITVQGDMWDSIAHQQLGSVDHVGQLLQLNRQYHDYYIFPAGIVLELPEMDTASGGTAETLPPWKQVKG